MDSLSDADVWRLWQQQAREELEPPLDEIRTKAERLDAKTRRWRVVTTSLFVLILMVEGWQVWTGQEVLERAGDLLTIAALLFQIGFHRISAVVPDLGGRSKAN